LGRKRPQRSEKPASAAHAPGWPRLPVAFIDFDTAADGGEPLDDLGYMAWTWCISSRADGPPNTRWWTERLSDPGRSAVGSEQINSSIEWSEREHAYTSTHCRVFAAALR
jgi:aminoglycoside phosphotransferase (APT) family kinase protein